MVWSRLAPPEGGAANLQASPLLSAPIPDNILSNLALVCMCWCPRWCPRWTFEDYRYVSGRRIVTIRFGSVRLPSQVPAGHCQDPPRTLPGPSWDLPRTPPGLLQDLPRTLPGHPRTPQTLPGPSQDPPRPSQDPGHPMDPLPEPLLDPLGRQIIKKQWKHLTFPKLTQTNQLFSQFLNITKMSVSLTREHNFVVSKLEQ